MLKICTDITGDQEAYETYGTQVREEVEAVLASVPETGEAEQKRILFIRAGSKYSATKAKTAENNFVCVMLKELGTYNAHILSLAIAHHVLQPLWSNNLCIIIEQKEIISIRIFCTKIVDC